MERSERDYSKFPEGFREIRKQMDEIHRILDEQALKASKREKNRGGHGVDN